MHGCVGEGGWCCAGRPAFEDRFRGEGGVREGFVRGCWSWEV